MVVPVSAPGGREAGMSVNGSDVEAPHLGFAAPTVPGTPGGPMGAQTTEPSGATEPDDSTRRRRPWPRRRRRTEPEAAPALVRPALPEDFDIGPGDPLLRVAQAAPGPI